MGTLSLFSAIIFGCFLIFANAQNASSPMDVLNSLKTSVEAAGAGAIKFGPMGLLGDLSGQFGVKVNKESTSGSTASIVGKRNGKREALLGGKIGSLSKNDPKNCYRRGGGYPIIIPIIVSTTAAPATTAATTTAAAGK